MKKFLKRQLGNLLGYEAELEKARMTLVAVSVAATCNTRKSAEQQRLNKESPWWHPAVGDVHAAVDREIDLRDRLQKANEQFSFSISARDNLREALVRKNGVVESMQAELDLLRGDLKEARGEGIYFIETPDQTPVMKELLEARARIADMIKGDDGQAWKEAEKYMARASVTDVVKVSTKTCVKCNSDMIPLHSEDKKLCSNGACGHEIPWVLEEGQEYTYKRNVEPFVEDRSNVKEAIEE